MEHKTAVRIAQGGEGEIVSELLRLSSEVERLVQSEYRYRNEIDDLTKENNTLRHIVEGNKELFKRSALDTTMCSYCGELMLTLPDGGNLCVKCAEENK